MIENLPKSSEYLLAQLYRAFKDKTSNGQSIAQSKMFGSFENIKRLYLPEFSDEDVIELINSLKRADFLDVKYADNVPYFIFLTDKSIATFEQRFRNNLDKFIDYFAKLKP